MVFLQPCLFICELHLWRLIFKMFFMFDNDDIYEEFSSDSIEEIVRERNKNKALRKMLPLTFDNDKDNTHYYLLNSSDDGRPKKELLTDDFFNNLEKRYSGSALPASNNMNGQTTSNNSFTDKIKTAVHNVVGLVSDNSLRNNIDNEKENDVSLNYVRTNLRSVNDDEDYYNRNTPDAKTLDWATRNLTNAKIAYDVGFIHPKLKNISSGAQRFAQKIKDVEGEASGVIELNEQSSRIGALRHPIWQAYITSKYDKGVAKIIGDNHEENHQMDLSVQKFKKMSDADAVTDLLNNQIGRRIGEINNGNTIKEFSLKVLDEYFKNGLYSLRYGDDDYWYVKKNKIPQSEYLKLKKIYSLADNNGFLPGDDKNINLADILDMILKSYNLADSWVKNKIETLYENAKKYIYNNSNSY